MSFHKNHFASSEIFLASLHSRVRQSGKLFNFPSFSLLFHLIDSELQVNIASYEEFSPSRFLQVQITSAKPFDILNATTAD